MKPSWRDRPAYDRYRRTHMTPEQKEHERQVHRAYWAGTERHARAAELQRAIRARLRIDALKHYCPDGMLKCAWCGNEDTDVLTFDHVDNDGCKHRRLIGRNGTRFIQWLRVNDFPTEPRLQVLCANCQVKKERKRQSESCARSGRNRR